MNHTLKSKGFSSTLIPSVIITGSLKTAIARQGYVNEITVTNLSLAERLKIISCLLPSYREVFCFLTIILRFVLEIWRSSVPRALQKVMCVLICPQVTSQYSRRMSCSICRCSVCPLKVRIKGLNVFSVTAVVELISDFKMLIYCNFI